MNRNESEIIENIEDRVILKKLLDMVATITIADHEDHVGLKCFQSLSLILSRFQWFVSTHIFISTERFKKSVKMFYSHYLG